MIKNYGWIFFLVLIFFFNCTTHHKVEPDIGLNKVAAIQNEKINHTHNLLVTADSLYRFKNYKQAVKLYKNVYSNSPYIINKPEYFFKIGYSYYSLQKPDSAILLIMLLTFLLFLVLNIHLQVPFFLAVW